MFLIMFISKATRLRSEILGPLGGLMFLNDLKTLKTLIPQKAFVFNVLNVFKKNQNIKHIKTIKHSNPQRGFRIPNLSLVVLELKH